jgi:uncharacterized membrane protein YbhN (UPF0104 family)
LTPKPLIKLVKFVGNALAVLSILFIGVRLAEHFENLDLSRLDGTLFLVVSVLAVLYAVTTLLLAVAWRDLIVGFGAMVTYNSAIRIYGLSQIAKYLPGNIFHLAGRQALGMTAGIPGWVLIKSSLFEILLLVLFGAAFLCLLAPVIDSWWSNLNSGLLFLLVATIAIIVIGKFLGFHFCRASALYILFLALSGLLFLGVCIFFLGSIDTPYQIIIAAYVVAWSAGFVSPGVPAGVGIREAVLLLVLGSEIPEAELLTVALVSRVVTIFGDVLLFAGVYLLKDEHGLD